jgi:hypothetical protein
MVISGGRRDHATVVLYPDLRVAGWMCFGWIFVAAVRFGRGVLTVSAKINGDER